jgi:hypothetical protein
MSMCIGGRKRDKRTNERAYSPVVVQNIPEHNIAAHRRPTGRRTRCLCNLEQVYTAVKSDSVYAPRRAIQREREIFAIASPSVQADSAIRKRTQESRDDRPWLQPGLRREPSSSKESRTL